MTWSCMDPLLARMALRQSGLPEAFTLLAYIEGYALVVGSLGVRLVPALVAREAVTAVLDGRRPWQPTTRTFPAHLRAVAHEAMAERLQIEARSRALGGDDAVSSLRMASAQVGELTGVAEYAHAAAELMPFVRVGDLALRDESVRLADDMRRRLAAIAPATDDIEPARKVAAPGPFAAPRVVVTVPRERDDEPTKPRRRAPMTLVRPDIDKTPREKP